jgi:tRNA threonylcarbamoyladenosine biosynthesis protein TsaE
MITHSPAETKRLGERLAKKILKKGLREKAVVLGLIGELGSGKTTFLQGFAQGLNIRKRILSPTFVLMKRFEIKGKSEFENFFHLDCYRIEESKELEALGLKDIIQSSQNIVAVEWAERAKGVLSPETILLKFEVLDNKKRLIKALKYPPVDNPLDKVFKKNKIK